MGRSRVAMAVSSRPIRKFYSTILLLLTINVSITSRLMRFSSPDLTCSPWTFGRKIILDNETISLPIRQYTINSHHQTSDTQRVRHSA